MKQAHQAVQAMGGAGFLNDSPVSRIFRDAKLMEIGAGTSEIRRMLVGRELMGGKARDRHLARGKMLPRDRVANLLDPGSPFLEVGATAAHGMYDGAAPARA
jgi:acetyl-CoA carboxylase carboxyltransferase component